MSEGASITDGDAIAGLCGNAATIVVTKNALDFGVPNTKVDKKRLCIFAFLFLYLLGYAEKKRYKILQKDWVD